MIVIGLTGSIGMGKSTAANMLGDMGVPVHDSDAAVHELLAPGGAGVEPVRAAFPATYDKATGGIDRKALGKAVFGDAASLRVLESILHPLVQQSQQSFIRAQQRAGIKIVALDIPLLFETGAEQRCDYTVVVSAPYEIQRQRVLARPGMTEEMFQQRLAQQMSDADKRARADFVVKTGIGLAHTRQELAQVLRVIKKEKGLNNDGHRIPPYDR
jgi:dephospho-CoA kinase